MATLGERVARLEEQVRDIRSDVDRIDDEVNRPGNGGRRSLRQRLHSIEGSGAAAIELERELRKRAQDERSTSGQRWSRRQQVFAAAVALVVALGPYIAPYLHGR